MAWELHLEREPICLCVFEREWNGKKEAAGFTWLAFFRKIFPGGRQNILRSMNQIKQLVSKTWLRDSF
jgi:hypothetical protein